VCAALLAAIAGPAQANPNFGSLTQLSGPFGCTSDGGTEGCATGRALRGAASVAVSPDGRNVYAAANNNGSVVVFRRDRRSGVIVQRGCLSAGLVAGCTRARGLSGAFSLTVSSDGRNVYVATFRGVAVFARATAGGALRQLPGGDGCVSQDGLEGCAPGRGLTSPAGVTLSPDGRNVYVASTGSSAVAVFSRDTGTGALHEIPGPEGCVSQGGAEGCIPARGLGGAFSVAVSPNGRHAYVAALNSNALSVFERDPDDGAIIQLPGTDACVSKGGAEGCAAGRGLSGPNGVAVSLDGRSVYVASSGSGAVAAFARDPELGTVVQLPGAIGCISQRGTDGCAGGRALTGAFAVTMSLDDVNAYAASTTAVVQLVRTRRTGVLSQLADSDVCTSQGGTENCLTGRALREASGVALSPDGKSAYVASYQSNAVATFARNPQDPRMRIRVRGLPRRCARHAFRARVSVGSTLPMARLRLFLNRRALGTRRGTRKVTIRILPRRLRRGRNRLRVDARDVGGNLGRRKLQLRRCRR
jgi:DNA-binding beta-propeller fold protein YncE